MVISLINLSLNWGCMEGFSVLIGRAKWRGELHGVNHLLFADDYFIFCKVDGVECELLANILENYGNASGKLINFHKSEAMFSKNTPLIGRVGG